MNENLEILVAVLVALLIGSFVFVFTMDLNATFVAGLFSMAAVFLAVQTFKEDK